jgi:iron-sulfur cluster assembly accessory protein
MEISLNMVVDEPKVEQPALKVTPEAAKEAKRLLQLQGTPDMVIRIAVQGGGCSGFTYQMKFDTKAAEFDEVIQTDDAKFVVDAKSALFLKGTTLDYVNALMGGGFKFVNPNATSTCGCGESFSA